VLIVTVLSIWPISPPINAATSMIYINQDESIAGTNLISCSNDTYIIKADSTRPICVGKDNIIIDGKAILLKA